MRRQQLELLTIQAVERVLTGNGNEDSLIEFKSEWPDVSKSRQLAGHANSAQGEEIIWIIGVNEKQRKLTHPAKPDLATWWAQVGKRFDGQVTPEMTDLSVQIGHHGSVTSLLFQTDRAPYVVITEAGGKTERDVPIRDGTRTRSATRYELLRLLTPATSVPTFSLLGGEAHLSSPVTGYEWFFDGDVAFYAEQPIGNSCFLPAHGMSGLLTITVEEGEPLQLPLTVTPSHNYRDASGTTWRADGALIDGPSRFAVHMNYQGPDFYFSAPDKAKEIHARLEFSVAGAQRRAIATVPFSSPTPFHMPSQGRRLAVRVSNTD
ncbi:hypothetical protein [Streptomyces sp. NPDC045470]|uniref:hypothetical protein n=1 Tax=Streptomyces sp. NPDC045470 TaxID=3155469 RepID=UPI0033F6C6ED